MKKLMKLVCCTTIGTCLIFALPLTGICGEKPVQRSLRYKIRAGYPIDFSAKGTIYTVPSGKRLVIEYFSCESSVAAWTQISCSITTKVDDKPVIHSLPTTRVTRKNTNTTNPITKNVRDIQAGQLVKLYADPNTDVAVSASRNGNCINKINVYLRFSGYLQDY